MYFLADHLKKSSKQSNRNNNPRLPVVTLGRSSVDISAVTPVRTERRISLDPSGFQVPGLDGTQNHALHFCTCPCNNDSASIKSDDDEYEEGRRVPIPESSTSGFSFRKLWAFTGPGVLISITYLDPGNIESDLQSGAAAKYQLLWVLLWSTVFGLIMQRLAARLGTVSGLDLAEACRKYYSPVPRVILWLMAEAAVVGAEMQEVIGSATAFYLLSNTVIPLWAGMCLSVVHSYVLLMLESLGVRKLEALYGVMIGIMAVSFGYQYAAVGPNHTEVMTGLLVPSCRNCNKNAFMEGIGIVGAIVMPHSLYLHSALVKTRKIDRSSPARVKEANKYYFIETMLALFFALLINLFIVSVFGHGLWDEAGTLRKSNADILQLCVNANVSISNDSNMFQPNIYTGGVFLGCQYGDFARYIWAIGILAAGQSSTMTGTYAGQFIMEGFLNLRLPRWKRALVTRILVLLPPLLVAKYLEIEELTQMNDALNTVMSMLLPFAILPLISMTSKDALMGQFKNGKGMRLLACGLTVLLISVNMYFVSSFLARSVPKPMEWYAAVAIIGFGAVYVSLCTFLFFHAVLSVGLPAWSVETITNLMLVVVVNILIFILAYLVTIAN